MIALRKGPQPEVIAEKGADWTGRFVAHEGALATMAPSLRYCYREPTIKAAVKRDSSDKCVYCESFMTQVHPGEIEHILPVSKRRDLVVNWENLAFVCTECNREKGDYLEETLPLLNPYDDGPAEHLAFYGPVVHHRTGASRGEATVRQLKLARGSLLERRKERIEQLQLLLDRIADQPEGPLREALERALEEELAESREYTAVSREYVRQAREQAT
jgi:HNH endonuclease